MKTPEISVNEWQKAEEESRIVFVPQQPKGSVTALQYGAMMGHGVTYARELLKLMVRNGKAVQQRWRCSTHNYCDVYTLKK